jgi:hypothetical protein
MPWLSASVVRGVIRQCATPSRIERKHHDQHNHPQPVPQCSVSSWRGERRGLAAGRRSFLPATSRARTVHLAPARSTGRTRSSPMHTACSMTWTYRRRVVGVMTNPRSMPSQNRARGQHKPKSASNGRREVALLTVLRPMQERLKARSTARGAPAKCPTPGRVSYPRWLVLPDRYRPARRGCFRAGRLRLRRGNTEQGAGRR